MDTQSLQKQIDDLKRELERVSQKRIFQQDIVPDVVKMRHMGEANRFVWAGLEANRPTEPPNGTDSTACYFATNTNKLYIWNGTAWKSATLS